MSITLNQLGDPKSKVNYCSTRALRLQLTITLLRSSKIWSHRCRDLSTNTTTLNHPNSSFISIKNIKEGISQASRKKLSIILTTCNMRKILAKHHL